jgi:hypothetical protein
MDEEILRRDPIDPTGRVGVRLVLMLCRRKAEWQRIEAARLAEGPFNASASSIIDEMHSIDEAIDALFRDVARAAELRAQLYGGAA